MFSLRSAVAKAVATKAFQPMQASVFSRYMSSYFLDPKEVTDRVISVLNRFERIQNKDKIDASAHFNKDLGLDRCVALTLCLSLFVAYVFLREDIQRIHFNDAPKIAT